ncbi:MFS transporter [Rickettsia endosymbiont of Halotydeus destructor]|uniref:MFS transporter n=1 Tax=Rickettsia endosymbiont of Halotydeus destructor TaxID=2996754 RepID=UPI003BB1B1C9
MKLLSTLINPNRHYLIGILLSGLTSGLAFILVFFTIPYQLSEAKYNTAIIGSMSLTAFPYCLKVIWSPFIDKYSIPFLCSKFGQRRGWALTAQAFLLLSMISFLFINPINNLYVTAIIAFIISFCAATQDIILDAYRIERPATKEELSLAVTFSGIGFRLGMLIGSVGALYLSSIFSWQTVYQGAFAMTLVGPIVILCIKEPKPKEKRHTSLDLISIKQYFEVIRKSISSLKSGQACWPLTILFIFLYKAGDSIPMAMSSPLFLDLSFTAHEIASLSKAYGLLVMILGGLLGGLLTSRIGIFYSILISGTIQLLSPLMFMWLAITGHDIPTFIATITVQSFCSGLAGTAIAIYLASLCKNEFIATEYAIIASLSSLVRITLASLGGFFAKYISWPQFFLGNTLFSMLFIIVFLRIYNQPLSSKSE